MPQNETLRRIQGACRLALRLEPFLWNLLQSDRLATRNFFRTLCRVLQEKVGSTKVADGGRMGIIFSFLTFFVMVNAEIVFPENDPLFSEKQSAIEEMFKISPKNSALETVVQSDKIVLWANRVLMKKADSQEIMSVEEPSFTAVTANNESFIRTQIEQNCECSLMGKEIGGIIVANPYQAAEMYFREGWLGHKQNEVDGYAPPIVIIYHEISHAGDYLRDQNYFLDMASMSSKQWKNGAEQSAVVQQNDFVRAVNLHLGTRFSSRLSYGKNQLYMTSGLFSVERL